MCSLESATPFANSVATVAASVSDLRIMAHLSYHCRLCLFLSPFEYQKLSECRWCRPLAELDQIHKERMKRPALESCDSTSAGWKGWRKDHRYAAVVID